jgi:SAM-dependent methyltransferase
MSTMSVELDASREEGAPALRQIPPSVVEAAVALGQRYGVSGALNPHDHIFWHIHDDPSLPEKTQAADFYFESGRQTAAFLRDLLNEQRLKAVLAERVHASGPLFILEFASGYGRVTRHFPTILPAANVVACDIHREAVWFLRNIGLQACLSSSVPERLDTGRTFDVVFALSFFTHMPRATWTRWLRSLANQVTPGGVLVFTAHGEVSQGLIGVSKLERDGFYFVASSEQKDIPVCEYGGTVTAFDYVYSQFAGSDLKLLQYKQAGIGHHDVYVLHRERDPAHNAQSPALYQEENRKLAEENAPLDAALKAIRTSRSWKVTSPLRALANALRRR